MVMKMLTAGGLSVISDGLRTEDEDNPGGYYEFEQVKQLKRDNAWVSQAVGKGIKVISQLLQFLPADFDYKVLFMRRSLEEVLASQLKMMERRGKTDAVPDEILRNHFEKHLQDIDGWLTEQRNFAVLNLPYGQVLADPQGMSDAIVDFSGLLLDTAAMAAVVDDRLYRQRATDG